jgi:mannose-6-phosphate isomerase-like protein (cupin superfamily)
MKSMMQVIVLLFAACALSVVATAAQQAASSPNKNLGSTYISAADVQANINGAADAATNPSPNIRVVNAGQYNVAVGVLHRPQTPPGVVAVHYKVTEVYHVIGGAATLVTGGKMIDRKERPADSRPVKLEDGPGASGTSIEGGVTQNIKTGDVVVIPAGVPHWFSKIDGSITYVVVRFDPSKVLTPK